MFRPNISSTLQSLIILIFIALITLSPSLNIIPKALVRTSFHDSHRLVELLLLAFVLLHEALSNQPKQNFLAKSIFQYSVFALVTIGIISSFFAISPRHALVEISLFAGLSFWSVFVKNFYLDYENKLLLIKRLSYVFWVSVLLFMTSFYTGYITATISNTSLKWPDPITGFTNIRSFNQYQLWTLGLLTLPLLNDDSKLSSKKYWLHLGLSFWIVLLFYSASRGALLAWICGILATLIIYRKAAWSFVRIQIFHMVSGFIIYRLLFTYLPNINGTDLVMRTMSRATTSDRIELWSLCLDLIRSHPLLGIGPMNYAWVNAETSAHPHNSLLQIMSEWGIPAAIIVLFLVFYGFRFWLNKFNAESLKVIDKFDQNMIIILLFTMITSAAYSLVDGVIVMPISQIMMFAFIGLAIGFYSKEQSEFKNKFAFKSILPVIVLATLTWSTLPEILQAISGSEKHFSLGYPAHGPRIWLEVK